ncbi:MAG: trimethylamine methyltransferase family protein [Synergistes jonesii]|uniref:trimethylamine methyltransferase family protein n=1 Tax=Synergistes jonesii TaxID=2754 RepID=UPI002A76515E|nr:trimethylamine methyltransferase family protein [Synergistes jonesii]MDY2984911.1 trimethylamine methyltransferase family protein [Synergistes jonesii]
MQPSIKILSDEEVRHIDRLSRDVLTDVGFICEDEESVLIFAKAGAKVENKSRVYLTDKMISDAVAASVPVAELHGRCGRTPMMVGGDNLYFGTTGFATNYLDYEKDEYRPSTSEDVIEITKLCEQLDPPDYILAPVGATDVDPDYADLYEFKAGMLYSSKHIEAQAKDLTNAKKIIKMAEYIAGGRENLKKAPFFSFLVTLTSPLHHRADSMQLIIESAKYGIPLFVESGPMAGATSPVTLSDTVAIANAELLSSLVLAKLVNPAIPFVYASWARVINMKNGNVSVGCPEFGMLRVATTQMGKFYNLPTGGGANLSDSLEHDHQLGAEQCSTSLLPALGGINMAQGMGLLAGMNAVSAETLVLASEVASYVKRIKKGIDVDMSRESFELIKGVGPRGDFLSGEHTLEHFRKELWTRAIFDCSPVRNEKKHLETVALRSAVVRKNKLMSKYKPIAVPEGSEEALEKIIKS